MKYIQRCIDLDKKYRFPEKLSYKEIDSKHLIISINTANWILLHNDNQRRIFDMLGQSTVGEVLEYIEDNKLEQEDLIHVLTELEAKNFENPNGNWPSSKGMCVYLTNECNLRCTHCYMRAGEKLRDELITSEVMKLLSEFKNHGGQHITFTGGEVTLRDDLCTILKYSKESGLVNTVLTNGILWSEDLIEITYPYIDEVQISIDGFDEESNSKIRGKGFWDIALNTVDRFCKKRTKVSVVLTPSLESIRNNYEKYVVFVQGLIAKYNSFDFSIRFSYELLSGRNIKPTEEDNGEYTSYIGELENSCYPGNKLSKFATNHEDNMIIDNCGYGQITVAADGTIYFCNRIPELRAYGNIRDIDFGEIWNLSINVLKSSNINNFKPCSDCDIKYICGGGCRITYFPQVLNNSNIPIEHSNRQGGCSNENKDSYYQLMIEANELFYR